MGVFLSLIALVAWGFGDFFIQKNAKKFGDWQTLFYICFLASVVFLPFVWREIPNILGNPRFVFWLLLTSCIYTLAAILEIKAFKYGKLAVIEPTLAFELPLTVVLATFFLKEFLPWYILIFVILVIVGLFLVTNQSLQKNSFRKRSILCSGWGNIYEFDHFVIWHNSSCYVPFDGKLVY